MTGPRYRMALLAQRGRPDVVHLMKLTRQHYQRHRRNSLVIENRLVKEPRSAWNQLPWRMELGTGASSPR